jgi:hypothetical protein
VGERAEGDEKMADDEEVDGACIVSVTVDEDDGNDDSNREGDEPTAEVGLRGDTTVDGDEGDIG